MILVLHSVCCILCGLDLLKDILLFICKFLYVSLIPMCPLTETKSQKLLLSDHMFLYYRPEIVALFNATLPSGTKTTNRNWKLLYVLKESYKICSCVSFYWNVASYGSIYPGFRWYHDHESWVMKLVTLFKAYFLWCHVLYHQ